MADDPGASPSIITRTLGPSGGAAAKGGLSVASVTTMLNYAFECHDKHMLLHPDAATQGVMAAFLVMAFDEFNSWLIRRRQKKSRRSDDPPSQGA